MRMAEVERLNVGAVISCTDVFGESCEGEVLAYDDQFKIVVLKCPFVVGKSKTHDVKLINLEYINSVVFIRPATAPPKPLTNLNFEKLANRVKNNVEGKMRQVDYVGIGVSELAQKLLNSISRIVAEVTWNGQNIVVMDEVTISPPYQADNCKAPDGSSALHLVQNLVEKFHKNNMKSASPTV